MTYILIVLFNVISSIGFNQTSNNSLVVIIQDIPSQNGQLVIRLHNSEDNFPISVLKEETLIVSDNQAKVVFKGLSIGEYAVSVIHDKNKNGKLDFNFFHMPTEKTCVSNDAKGFLGPPKFKNAKFELNKDKEIIISF